MQTCDVTEVNSGATFTIRCDDIILDGALAQGISLPHQCRGASCGTCKARVIEGEVDHGWSLGDALSDEEKSRGYCLLCQARPVTDTLRIETVAPVQSPSEVRERKAEVASVVNLTPRVKRVVLALPAHEDFRYAAGAYVEFQLDGVTPNRMYSLASPEREDGLLEFWVARHPEGLASGYIHDELAVGDSVRILGPFGHCRMPGGSGPVIGLAGGTGLAPSWQSSRTRYVAGRRTTCCWCCLCAKSERCLRRTGLWGSRVGTRTSGIRFLSPTSRVATRIRRCLQRLGCWRITAHLSITGL